MERTLTFIRKIENIESLTESSTELIQKYIDIGEDGKLNKNLEDLKNLKLPNAYNLKESKSEQRSIFEYMV